MNGLMTTSAGRKTVSYLVKCALAANDSLVKADQNGNNYTFAGGIGLCPAWKNGGVSTDSQCMEGISACLMAHVNTAGVHVPLWLDSNDAVHRLGHRSRQLPDAGGDVLRRHHRHRLADQHRQADRRRPRPPTTATAPGSPRAPPASSPAASAPARPALPYTNPFGNGTSARTSLSAVGQFSQDVSGSCPAGSNANPAAGCPDGYKALTHDLQQRPSGSTASPCGATTTTRRCSTPATSTPSRPSSPRQPDGRRLRNVADSAVQRLGQASPPPSST